MPNDACQRVLTTRNIVVLFAAHMERRDLAHLAQTSRGIFVVTIELVWNELQGVHNLFKLIPSTKSQKLSCNKWNLTIPDMKSADLSRLKFYAPLVNHLHILPTLHASYQFSDWKKLSTYVESNILLPNLQTIEYACKASKDETFIRWVTSFLSPSVLTVHTHSHMWGFAVNSSARGATALIRAISNHAATVKNLSFFPVDPYFSQGNAVDDKSDEDETYLPVHHDLLSLLSDDQTAVARPPQFYDYFKKLQSLTSLTTTSFIIDSQPLEVLAGLPNLKELVLYCSYFNEYLAYQISSKFSDDSFRSLSILELFLADMECVRKVWGIRHIVNRLSEVILTLRLDTANSDEWRNAVPDFITFLPEICKRSPGIQKLVIDLDPLEGDTHYVLSSQTLRLLATLPLHTLDLRHTLLENIPEACQLLGKCQNLRKLHLQDQRITYDNLIALSRLPKLECLHAEIIWMDKAGLQKYKNSTPPQFSNLRLLHCSTSMAYHQDIISEYLVDILVVLCVYFTKLEEVSWVGTSMYGVGPGATDSLYVQMNDTMKTFKRSVQNRMARAQELH